jgi:excisionase family DNA binding protein
VFDRHTRELSPRERRAFAAIGCKIAERLASDRGAGGSRRTAADRDDAVNRAVARHGTAPGTKENVQLPFLMRTSEVASLFGVTTRTALNWATTGRLPSIRTAGNQVRFPSDGVLALLGTGPFHRMGLPKKREGPR